MATANSEMTNKILLPAAAVCSLVLAANPANADDWSFQIEPYLLGITIDGDAGIGRVTGADVDVDFDDILDNLDMGFMGRFEARHENGWGVAIDYAFVDVSGDRTSPRGAVLDAELRLGVLDAVLMKSTGSGDEQIDYFAGVRWSDVDVDVAIDPVILPGTLTSSLEEDWFDLIIGARWINPISEKWSFQLRGDVGGIGSDFTASGIVGFLYRFGESTELDLQYKALVFDYENNTPPGQPGYFKYDTTTHGPIIGFIFNF